MIGPLTLEQNDAEDGAVVVVVDVVVDVTGGGDVEVVDEGGVVDGVVVDGL